MCDTNVTWSGWYRLFIDGLSAQIPDTCVEVYSCSTDIPLWIPDGHPTVEDGVVTRDVCGHWDNYCCYYGSFPIKVKACPDNYYVYELVRPTVYCSGYCADVNISNTSSTAVTPAPISTVNLSVDPCYNYTVLDEPWRANISQPSNSYKCDISVSWSGWYRLFINSLSAQIPDTCIANYHCGTVVPLWIRGGHPKVEDGVVTRDVCGQWNNYCCYYRSFPIKVKACPGNYYVYELVSPTICNSTYCAVSLQPVTFTTITNSSSTVPLKPVTSTSSTSSTSIGEDDVVLDFSLQTVTSTTSTSSLTEGLVFMVGPNATLDTISRLDTTNSSVDIDLIGIAKNNNERSAAVAFMSFNTMENLLKPDFFNTSNDTIKTMMSTVISATLPKTTNTKLTKPVNFTLKHIREFDPSGSLSCVYWNISEWIVDGCSVLVTNSSYTVCSCVHLSTFALIMQTSRPPESNSLLDVLNLVCVIVGLVFFSLALLTFALCRWSPGVNNVARINICISLLLAHLLFLLTQQFLSLIRPHQVLCAVISGVLHFLFLSGFVWMFIEAVLLFICVKNLSQISSKKREVLSSRYLCVIGYTVALVVVRVSVGLVPEGYGSEQCWIKMDKGFIWSFLGPVCVILALNIILFINIFISLNSTLKKLNAEVSQMKQTKIMVFKTLAQFVVLGCSWILGFFINGSKELEILFLILNSQQGTFIFLVYCVLNNEIRQQYRKIIGSLCSRLKQH
ncbi:adhesion G protein-coupled receptor E3-like [Chanodichthys erythropterus]|uniref:adhesion G protein-coupled receptor E3-like n=1 Tax=Chanodichthys erythropterus TaxID=933992 RepID=UPI00351E98F8